jgi:predicted amidophosphoribosyltransferase
MPSVAELTATSAGFLLSPRAGQGVCVDCFNFTRGFDRCYACSSGERSLDVVVPISYSVANEPLHHALAYYKRTTGLAAERGSRELAATLWRFLVNHEACVAHAARVERFDVITTVPSSDRQRDGDHPLRRIVGELVAPTRRRHERLLQRTEAEVVPRRFDPNRYESSRRLDGRNVLLIDDTWTTGASAQSAAAALQAAGAQRVACVVIGRHVNREWYENDRRLHALATRFDWGTCPLCASEAPAEPQAPAEPTRIHPVGPTRHLQHAA